MFLIFNLKRISYEKIKLIFNDFFNNFIYSYLCFKP